MKRIRTFFLQRQLREKILLGAFVGVAAAIWLSNLSDRILMRAREVRLTTAELKVQKNWLVKTVEIEAAAKSALESWDPKSTFNAVRLNAEVSSIAGGVGIKKNYTIDTVPSQRSSEFASFHSVRLTARDADFEALKAFYFELLKRSPYIGLEQFVLSANRTNATLVNANFLVTSVELTR